MATFEFEGKQVSVLYQEVMELGDLAFMKEHFGIEGLVDLETRLVEMEPVACRALLIASARRVKPDISPDDKGADSVAILPLIQAMNADRDERLAQAAKQEGRARPTTSGTRGRTGSRK